MKVHEICFIELSLTRYISYHRNASLVLGYQWPSDIYFHVREWPKCFSSNIQYWILYLCWWILTSAYPKTDWSIWFLFGLRVSRLKVAILSPLHKLLDFLANISKDRPLIYNLKLAKFTSKAEMANMVLIEGFQDSFMNSNEQIMRWLRTRTMLGEICAPGPGKESLGR